MEGKGREKRVRTGKMERKVGGLCFMSIRGGYTPLYLTPCFTDIFVFSYYVNGRDRDETETSAFRDRGVGFISQNETRTR